MAGRSRNKSRAGFERACKFIPGGVNSPARAFGGAGFGSRGSDGPFDPRIHALRGQPGQIDVAQYYRQLLAGSAIRKSLPWSC